ncbi:hypothetical protein, partial [Methanohalophilus sp. DAL1]|uniref:hypothetical protein n=1 Tax=Methanohalophilus sp. DAL1 TaxID=1864608 RepID=UPI0008177F45
MKMQGTNFIPPCDLHTPVLFLIFNRPETTKLVFEEIKKAKPPRLYIAADGARNDKQGETEKVTQVREYVMNNIDWKCEVKTLFRDNNLGCKYAVSGAIDWFFENEEMGIILEDDCLPSQSFFWFCEELLERYMEDERIMMISGTNKATKWNSHSYDYFYSYYGSIWGWASWKRAWMHYDRDMNRWKDIRNTRVLKYLYDSIIVIANRIKIYENTYSGKIDTWDYQWVFSREINSGLSIVPSKNLISNIGFSSEATHTKNIVQYDNNIDKFEIDFPVKFNNLVVSDKDYDKVLL